MSADKRKTILIGFAGLAVVLVAIIAIVSPSFRSEDATGAIGAVQKHRAPQITKQDVVLGDETQKQQQKVLYADFIADATQLKSFAVAAKDDQLRARIDSMEQDVQSRFRNDMEQALSFATQLAAAEEAALGSKKKAAVIAEIDGLGAAIRQAERLSSNDIESLSLRLNQVSDELGVKQYARIEARKLDNVADLQAAVNRLNAMDLASNLQLRMEYALAMAKESNALAHAPDAELAVRLNETAEFLGKSAEMNMKRFVESESLEVAELGKMAESIATLRATSVANTAEFNAVTQSFTAHAAEANTNLNVISLQRASYAAILNDSDAFAMQASTLASSARDLANRFAK